jgi:uncharacterized membrane protein YdbT with pleckstrin-like domain
MTPTERSRLIELHARRVAILLKLRRLTMETPGRVADREIARQRRNRVVHQLDQALADQRACLARMESEYKNE